MQIREVTQTKKEMFTNTGKSPYPLSIYVPCNNVIKADIIHSSKPLYCSIILKVQKEPLLFPILFYSFALSKGDTQRVVPQCTAPIYSAIFRSSSVLISTASNLLTGQT